MRKVKLIVGSLLFCFLLLETTIRVVFLLAGGFNTKQPIDELNGFKLKFEPYTVTTLSSHNKISHYGRVTKNAYPVENANIFIFGGSTTIGEFVEDEQTIPSYFSELLSNNGYKYHVRNYGVPSYVFTQEVIKLMFLLRSGERPKMVVFYNGANDIVSAFMSRKAGAIYRENYVRNKYEFPQLFEARTVEILKELVKRIKVFGVIRSSVVMEESTRYTPDELNSLSNQVVKYYFDTFDLLARLSWAYGFDYCVFFQPLGEPKIGRDFKKFYVSVSSEIEAIKLHSFYNISDVFDKQSEDYYLDGCHLNKDGNLIVAKKIFSILHESGRLR